MIKGNGFFIPTEIGDFHPTLSGDYRPTLTTSKMIELWKAKAPIVEPYRMPLWKKMILQETKDLWVKGL